MKVIFWDFDGTLVYSGSLWSNSVYNALKMVCPDTTVMFNDIRACMASGFTWHSPDEDYSKIINEKWWQHMNCYFYDCYVKLGVSKEYAKLATDKIRTIIKQKQNYTLYSDTIEILELMKNKNIKNVLLSNNYPDLCDVLKSLKIYDLFDEFVISAAVGYDKPRKEIFEFAKNIYPDAEEYYMVGDSINADIIGGKNAGLNTILVHKGFDKQADYCIDNLIQLKEILE